MAKVIRHQFSYSHPVETVWEYLTNPDLIELWLMKNNFKPVMGHEFQFRMGPVPSLNLDGVVYCKVLAIVPCRHLSYSWNTGPGNGEMSLESTVTWDLKPTGKGTDLFLEHSGFAKKKNLDIYTAMLRGWVEKFEKIDTLLNSK